MSSLPSPHKPTASDWTPPLTQARREQAAYARLRENAVRWTYFYIELATEILDCDEERLVELMLENRLHPCATLFKMMRDGRSRDDIKAAFLSEYDNGKVSQPNMRFGEGYSYMFMISFGVLWNHLVHDWPNHPFHSLLKSLSLEEALIRYFCFYRATASFYYEDDEIDHHLNRLNYPDEKGEIPDLSAFDQASLEQYGIGKLVEMMNQAAPWGSNKYDYCLLDNYGVNYLDKYSYMRYVIRETMTLPSRAKSARSLNRD